LRYLVPLEENAGLASRLSSHFRRAPYFAVVEIRGGEASYEIKPNPAAGADPGAGPCGVLDILASFGADAIVARRVGIRAARRLREAGVEVYEAPPGTLGDVIAGLKSGSLRRADLEAWSSRPCGQGSVEGTAFYPPPPWPPPPPMPYPPHVGPAMPTSVGRPPERLKIAFSTNGRAGLDDTIAGRFARCPTFTVVEVEGGRVLNVEVHDNPFTTYPHGAGFAVAQFLANMGVNAVVAPRFGPNAWQALASLGISVHVVPAGTRVREALRSVVG